MLRRHKSDPSFAFVEGRAYPTYSKVAESLKLLACDDDCLASASLNDDSLTSIASTTDEHTPISPNDDFDWDTTTTAGSRRFSFADAATFDDADDCYRKEVSASVHSSCSVGADFRSGNEASHVLQAAGRWQPSMLWQQQVCGTVQQMPSAEFCQLRSPWQDHGSYYDMQNQDSLESLVTSTPVNYTERLAASRLSTVSDRHQTERLAASGYLPLSPPPPPSLPQPLAQSKDHIICNEQMLDEQQMTVMVRNLPLDLSQPGLVQRIIERGYSGLFNFVYMPMNFRGRGNFGYAFVSFITHEVALQFMDDVLQSGAEQNSGENSDTQKWHVVWSNCQGLSANIERYRNSPLMHSNVPPEFKPAMYDELGNQVPFLPPTKTIPKPRIHWSGPKDANSNGTGDINVAEACSEEPSQRSPDCHPRPGRIKKSLAQRTVLRASTRQRM